MEIVIVVQARYGSSRLPGKVLLKIDGEVMLALQLRRIQRSQYSGNLIIATTFEPEAAAICDIANQMGVKCFKGDTNDVLARFYHAVIEMAPDYLVRLTADCPLIDPVLIDKIISFTLSHQLDYCTNTFKETYPDGQDIEVFTFSALQKAFNEAQLASEREHVTPFIRKNSDYSGGNLFKAANFDEGLSW